MTVYRLQSTGRQLEPAISPFIPFTLLHTIHDKPMMYCMFNHYLESAMTQTIVVRIKDVYGTQTVYPVCELAIGLAALAGTKTLTPAALKIIKSLGYQIAVESPLTV